MWPFKKSSKGGDSDKEAVERVMREAQQQQVLAREQQKSAEDRAAEQIVKEAQAHARNAQRAAGGAQQPQQKASAQVQQQQKQTAAAGGGKEGESIMAPPPAPPELPPGWKTAKDPASGRSYFFNKKLGITQWEAPSAVESVPPPPPAPPPTTTRQQPAADLQAKRQDSGLQDQYQCVLDELKEHSKSLMSRVKHFYSVGDKLAAVPLYSEKKYTESLTTWLADRKDKNLPLPPFKVMQRRVVTPDVSDVPKDKLRVSINSCSGIDAGGHPVRCRISFSWPRDTTQEHTIHVTPPAEPTDDETNQALLDVPSSSTAFQRQTERKHTKVSFEVFFKDKGWLSTKTTSLGTAQLPVFPLLATSSYGPTTLQLVSEKVRGRSAGEISVTIATHKPWAGGKEKMKAAVEKIIIVQDPLAPAAPTALLQEHQKYVAAGSQPQTVPAPASAAAAAGGGGGAAPQKKRNSKTKKKK
mmetsp:Transcript_45092/g.105804  ORF Transcript_45092/g.105804 Transcript_45092/m.105804 type:complete len:469 (+) Transcript_45092:140-1546(+)